MKECCCEGVQGATEKPPCWDKTVSRKHPANIFLPWQRIPRCGTSDRCEEQKRSGSEEPLRVALELCQNQKPKAL